MMHPHNYAEPWLCPGCGAPLWDPREVEAARVRALKRRIERRWRALRLDRMRRHRRIP